MTLKLNCSLAPAGIGFGFADAVVAVMRRAEPRRDSQRGIRTLSYFRCTREGTGRTQKRLDGARSPLAGEGAPIWNFEMDGLARIIPVVRPHLTSMSRHDLSAKGEYQRRTSGLGL